MVSFDVPLVLSHDPNNKQTITLSLQGDPRPLHHGQYQNQQPAPSQLQLAPYGDDRSVLHSRVTSDGASSSSVSIKHSQPLSPWILAKVIVVPPPPISFSF
ncbi:hypothetical protein L484_005051 [Morus notabilis]|uniref:Uncharacterized protein n=1 Tax=Morus notabilis TaxID=981085 RepID=W9QLK2_9ROSA|nr:hypothetical protein L484_005051 [Morus notabilis]